MEALRKNATNYGLFLGGFLVLTTTLIYATNINLLTSSWIGITSILIMTIFGILGCVKYRKSANNFITFKECFTSFFITVVLGTFISTVFSIILFNYIDVEAKEIITNNVIKYTVETMEKFGAKKADIKQMAEEMQKSDSFGLMGQLKGFAFNTILYSIIGLIVALIIKKERPQSI